MNPKQLSSSRNSTEINSSAPIPEIETAISDSVNLFPENNSQESLELPEIDNDVHELIESLTIPEIKEIEETEELSKSLNIQEAEKLIASLNTLEINSVEQSLESSENVEIDTEEKEEIVEKEELTPEIDIIEPSIESSATQQPLDSKQQINLTQKGDVVYVTLPLTIHTEHNQWQRILDDFNVRLRKIEKSWLSNTKVHLQTQDRLLDIRQIQDLNDIFASVNLRLQLVLTTRRQTAVAASSAGYSVQQESAEIALVPTNSTQIQDLAEPLYLKNTIRSGEEICHSNTVIIFGDVNPGATIISHGEIFVWGTLKGIAHAGAIGNRQALIMALRMEPTQIRIADLVARAPDKVPDHNIPEVAYISPHGIRIRGANSFTKTHSFVKEGQYWANQRDRLNLGFN